MTYSEILSYYADLLIRQYRNKPRAQAEIMVIARAFLKDNIILDVQNAFDVTTAIGVQLDVLAKYAGVTRQILTFGGGDVLADEDFRKLIYLGLARNVCTSSLKDIDDLLLAFFGNAIIAFDNKNMGMSYFFNSSFGPIELAEDFVREDMLPRPMGVNLSSIIYAGDVTTFFGFSSYFSPDLDVGGFQSYYDYDETVGFRPWLSYTDTITV